LLCIYFLVYLFNLQFVLKSNLKAEQKLMKTDISEAATLFLFMLAKVLEPLQLPEPFKNKLDIGLDLVSLLAQHVRALLQLLALPCDEPQRLVVPHLQVKAVADGHVDHLRVLGDGLGVEVAAQVDFGLERLLLAELQLLDEVSELFVLGNVRVDEVEFGENPAQVGFELLVDEVLVGLYFAHTRLCHLDALLENTESKVFKNLFFFFFLLLYRVKEKNK